MTDNMMEQRSGLFGLPHRVKIFFHRAIPGIILCSLLSVGFLAAQNTSPSPEKPYEDFNPANFDENSADITNEWMPMKPGMRYVYAGTTLNDEGKLEMHRLIVHVTDLVKVINGVRSLVSYDVDYSAGRLAEAENAFFAQDREGNVWLMGEYPEEYDEDGEFAEAPCWIAGLDEAVAGIAMKAFPWAGTPSYSQGWAPKVDFTDRGQVHEMGLTICVPMDCYENVLVIAETSLDEPGAFQHKYWAQGVGNVRVGFAGDDQIQEVLELVDVIELSPEMLAEVRAKALALEKMAYERKENKKLYGQTPPAVKRQ